MTSSRQLRDRLRTHLDPAPLVDVPSDAVPAAVLVPILGATSDPRIVFTKRTDTLSRHAGEISFPGGLVDPGEPPAAAALREAEEELGLAPSEVELVGALEPLHTRVTGILIVPFVGFLWKDPRFTPNAAEIAEVLEYPLSDLVASGKEADFEFEGKTFTTQVYEMEGGTIWGATGHILATFIDLIGRLGMKEEA
jgi:8-oxo-dGTP pyrophosphatase MutT (NUDIX family)